MYCGDSKGFNEVQTRREFTSISVTAPQIMVSVVDSNNTKRKVETEGSAKVETHSLNRRRKLEGRNEKSARKVERGHENKTQKNKKPKKSRSLITLTHVQTNTDRPLSDHAQCSKKKKNTATGDHHVAQLNIRCHPDQVAMSIIQQQLQRAACLQGGGIQEPCRERFRRE